MFKMKGKKSKPKQNKKPKPKTSTKQNKSVFRNKLLTCHANQQL